VVEEKRERPKEVVVRRKRGEATAKESVIGKRERVRVRVRRRVVVKAVCMKRMMLVREKVRGVRISDEWWKGEEEGEQGEEGEEELKGHRHEELNSKTKAKPSDTTLGAVQGESVGRPVR